MAKPGGYYILRSDIFFDDLRNKIWQPLWFQIISIRHILLVFCGLGPGDFTHITELWREGDWVHVWGQLIIGFYHLGASKKRNLAWLGQ